ncbi:unnamed protein product [Strongylus vulgaris]|uniref:Uncharacterized protein n=1 Tax=Strongylus vulgaris TaxID=40348 RepID=A0A3P7JFR9_STRVU|nr:unnamed protein product [Strongylus vulgaris]
MEGAQYRGKGFKLSPTFLVQVTALHAKFTTSIFAIPGLEDRKESLGLEILTTNMKQFQALLLIFTITTAEVTPYCVCPPGTYPCYPIYPGYPYGYNGFVYGGGPVGPFGIAGVDPLTGAVTGAIIGGLTGLLGGAKKK